MNKEKIKKRKKIIIELRNKGLSYSEIGSLYNISRQRVHSIIFSIIKKNRKKLKYKDEILERDKYKCVLCDNTENIIIHHIDSNPANNRYTNLITICRKCHTKIHNTEQFGIIKSNYRNKKETKKMFKTIQTFQKTVKRR